MHVQCMSMRASASWVRVSASVWALAHNVHSSLDWMLLSWALRQNPVPEVTMECWRNVNFRATLFKFLELSSRRARSRRLIHVRAWPCRPAWVVLWLRSSFQINDHKTAPANISEEMPQCDSRLIYRESYITLSICSGARLFLAKFSFRIW